MGLELAKAWVRVRGDTSQLKGDFNQAKGPLTMGMAALAGGISGAVVNQAIAVARQAVGAVISVMSQSISLAERQIDAETRIAAVIRATGGAAGYSADQLKKMASEMQKSTTFGDEAILESMAILLTFRGITKDVFKRTQEAAMDLSAAGYGPMIGISRQLAKALEDPARNMRQLARTGIQFTEQQEVQIKKLQESGDLLGAQREMLKAVEGQAIKTAEELAKTPAGKMKQLKNVLSDLREDMGKKLIPIINQFYEGMIRVQKAMNVVVGVVGSVVKGFLAFNQATGGMLPIMLGATITVLGLAKAFKHLGIAIKYAKVAMQLALSSTVILLPLIALGVAIGVIITAIKAMVNGWKKNEEQNKRLQVVMAKLRKAWELIKEAATKVIKAIAEIFKPLIGDVKGLGDTIGEMLLTALEWFTEFVLNVAEWINIIISNWDTAWKLMKTMLALGVSRMWDFVSNFFASYVTIAKTTWATILTGFWAYIDETKAGLTRMLDMVKVTGTTIKNMMKAAWGEGTVAGAFDEGMKSIKGLFAEANAAGGRVGAAMAETWQEGMSGIDLGKASAGSKLLAEEAAGYWGELAAKKMKMMGQRDKTALGEAEAEADGKAFGEEAAKVLAPILKPGERFGIPELGRSIQDALFARGKEQHDAKMEGFAARGIAKQDELIAAVKAQEGGLA